MSKKAMEYIKNKAWESFPAQELWINKNNEFWAFDIDDSDLKISYTKGIYKDDDIVFITDSKSFKDIDDLNKDLDSSINQRLSEKYKCFSIELRN